MNPSNNKLNESSFFRVMDQLNEEDELEKQTPKKPSPVKQIKMNKLNLNLLKPSSKNIIMVDNTSKGLCIENVKRNLLENIKRNSNFPC